jgi:hypothetical protein
VIPLDIGLGTTTKETIMSDRRVMKRLRSRYAPVLVPFVREGDVEIAPHDGAPGRIMRVVADERIFPGSNYTTRVTLHECLPHGYKLNAREMTPDEARALGQLLIEAADEAVEYTRAHVKSGD